MHPPAYCHLLCIRLHDTDAAGVMFYGHLFRHAHDAYEAFMEHLGYPLHDLIGSGDTATAPGSGVQLPITQAQARYLHPLRLGERVTVEVRVGELRRRSFAIDYRFMGGRDRVAAEAETVHCLIGPDPADLPAGLHRALAGALGAATATQEA